MCLDIPEGMCLDIPDCRGRGFGKQENYKWRAVPAQVAALLHALCLWLCRATLFLTRGGGKMKLAPVVLCFFCLFVSVGVKTRI